MSSADAQVVYSQSSYQPRNPMQEGFAQQFDLANPEKAMTSYQRIMHEHTKQQFDMVSRRRSSGSDTMASLKTEDSGDSMSSTAS